MDFTLHLFSVYVKEVLRANAFTDFYIKQAIALLLYFPKIKSVSIYILTLFNI